MGKRVRLRKCKGNGNRVWEKNKYRSKTIGEGVCWCSIYTH